MLQEKVVDMFRNGGKRPTQTIKQKDRADLQQESTRANGFDNNFTQTDWILFNELPKLPTTSVHGA